MVEKDEVSKDFRKQVLGYGLTTAEIVYRRADRHWLLQTYVWQDYDLFPNFPALKDFLAFWVTTLDGPLFAVTVAHSKLIKSAELHNIVHVLRIEIVPGIAGAIHHDLCGHRILRCKVPEFYERFRLTRKPNNGTIAVN